MTVAAVAVAATVRGRGGGSRRCRVSLISIEHTRRRPPGRHRGPAPRPVGRRRGVGAGRCPRRARRPRRGVPLPRAPALQGHGGPLRPRDRRGGRPRRRRHERLHRPGGHGLLRPGAGRRPGHGRRPAGRRGRATPPSTPTTSRPSGTSSSTSWPPASTRPTTASTSPCPRPCSPVIPLGREVIGSVDTVTGLDRDTIADFHAALYRAEDLLVAVAGPVDHDDMVARVDRPVPLRPLRRPASSRTPAGRATSWR